jgi:hypothetical protein
MNTKSSIHKGRLVAKVLMGIWRSSALPPLEISEVELDEVTPLLHGSGAGALGWRRFSQTDLSESPSAELLHQAYRLLSLQAEIQEQKIEKLFRVLREASIDALLAKGWAAAGLYPDRTLRPYGDIDLCIHPRHFKLAEDVLESPELSDCWIDLHPHFAELDDRAVERLFDRSRLVALGAEQIRILGPEDHLALLSIHLLKHGAWRPLWLCDIGAAVESLPTEFDWDVCLGKSSRRARWIVSTIGLANRLLQANIDPLPIAAEARELPTWLVENVLHQWANPFPINQPPMSHPVPMMSQLKSPKGLAAALRERWPDPILATISVNGRFNSFPRWPYQLASCMSRIVRLVIRAPGAAQ